MLDVNRLRTFSAVVEHGSFTEAARRLHLTQPAVSRQIATLERQLSTPLLVRARGGLQITAAGEVLLGHTAALLDRLALAEAEVAAISGRHGGAVRVGAFFSGLVHLSSEAAADLSGRHPDIRIVDDLVDRDTALARLGRGEIDLAIIFDDDTTSVVSPDGITIRHLFDDPVRILLPGTHRLADRAVIDLADLGTETWIQAVDGAAADLTERVLSRHGLDPPRLRAGHGAEPAENQALVAAGRGVTLTHDLTVIVSRHDLAILPIQDEDAVRHVGVAHTDGPRAPATDIVLDTLIDIGARHRRHPSADR